MVNLIETVASLDAFKVLGQALGVTGLDETLSELGPFTLFAPRDEAFARLPDGTLEGMFENVPQLRSVLRRHITPGVITMVDTMAKVCPKTLAGQTLSFTSRNGLAVNNARIITADIAADNGLLHILDDVIMENSGFNE